MRYFSVAIDGPGGAGKSTLAKLLAKELGYIYVDTGAMYRAVALYCLRQDADLNNENDINVLLQEIDITIRYIEEEQRIFLCGEDVSQAIRTPEISQGSSIVAAYAKVREKLVMLQQKIAENDNIIMDGRDIGSDVLPLANVKIYLDAKVSVRAQRRLKDLEKCGIHMNLDEVKREIEERDFRDMNRGYSPLKKANDAIVIDTSSITLLETKNYILDLIKTNNSY